MTNKADYQKGYVAGKRKSDKDIAKLKADEREERIYMKCLELALNNCNHWKIGKKPIDNAEGYCRLAKIFADNSIAELDR